jgi:ABC-type transport system involved in multi-copper enzyme maturation permease subunit
MRRQLLSSVAVHLQFYRRNRLLWIIGLVMLLMASISLTFSLFVYSDAKKFTQLTGTFQTLNGFAFTFTPLLGLFVVSSHLRGKQIKVIFTKPCLPETWLASCFVSAAAVSAALYGLILAFVLTASVASGIPVQSGFVFVTLREFLIALVALSYIMLLATAVHPVAAVLIILVMEEKAWYGMKFMLAASATSGHTPALARVGNVLVNAVYYVVPMLDPFSKQLATVYSSMRASGGDWLYLVYTAAYGLAAGLFFYLTSAWVLRRRALI